MSKFTVILIACSLIVACGSFGTGSGFKLNSVSETKYENGLQVLTIPDKSLPYISFILLLRSGSSADPEGLSGLSTLVGNLIDKGTKQRKALQIADDLGQLGANFNVSVGKDLTIVSASALSFYKDELLNNYSELIREPSFTGREVRRARNQTISRLKKLVDSPSAFSRIAFNSYLYGKHPYGANTSGSRRSLNKIRKKHIIRHYLKHYRPNNAILAVVGNFDGDFEKQVKKSFSDWKPRKLTPTEFPEMPKISGFQIRLVDKSDLKQSQILIGHKGIRRQDKDFLNLRLANFVLGGVFGSRLVDVIREQLGLTYTIRSAFEAKKDYGPFVISTFSRHDKVKETIQETLKVLTDFREKGVTAKEVTETKALLKGIFPRSLETSEALAQNMLVLRHYGISDDYLRDYIDDVDDLKQSQINAAIKQHIDPQNIKVLVFGPSRKLRRQLKTLGQLEVKPYKKAF